MARPDSDRSGSQRGPVHLADLIYAIHHLLPGPGEATKPDGGGVEAIAAALGFGLHPSRSDPVAADPAGGRPGETPFRRDRPEPQPRVPPPPLHPPLRLPARDVSEDSSLVRLEDRSPALDPKPDWLEEPNPETEWPKAIPRPAPARRLLFPRRQAGPLLSGLLATRQPGSTLDLRTLLARQLRGQPLRRLPMLPRWSLESGCDLLLDYSHSMMPFWPDLNALDGQLGHLLGRERLGITRFKGDALWLDPISEALPAIPWQPRHRGRPLLVATDFGCPFGGLDEDLQRAWQHLARRCRHNASPLIFLIPWPRSNWPHWVGAYPTLVHWDERTTASMVWALRWRQPGRGDRGRARP